jgi:hypothetical protein
MTATQASANATAITAMAARARFISPLERGHGAHYKDRVAKRQGRGNSSAEKLSAGNAACR